MRITRDGNKLNVAVVGPLGESSPFFTMPVADVKEMNIDMTEFTSINSIGVKNWIIWTLRIPKDCVVKLINCPMMIASQASTVLGFVNPSMTIESLRLPYVCENCNTESTRHVVRGQDYEYAKGGVPARITLPTDIKCTKCNAGKLEPDLIVSKTFKFLG